MVDLIYIAGWAGGGQGRQSVPQGNLVEILAQGIGIPIKHAGRTSQNVRGYNFMGYNFKA
ncbi:hypothetical protein LCGC14_0712720 [marine sediment metagenome]|uniref:Uncharacterized protein n=1 Tax=marine sediment metagenome TaxID=412755 RepID=A0A0F9T0C0_9ZZZZ